MLIWFFMAIGLIVLVAAGFVGRRQYKRSRPAGQGAGTRHSSDHKRRNKRNHRGRGRG